MTIESTPNNVIRGDKILAREPNEVASILPCKAHGRHPIGKSIPKPSARTPAPHANPIPMYEWHFEPDSNTDMLIHSCHTETHYCYSNALSSTTKNNRNDTSNGSASTSSSAINNNNNERNTNGDSNNSIANNDRFFPMKSSILTPSFRDAQVEP